MCSRLPGALQRCQHARTDSRKASAATWSLNCSLGQPEVGLVLAQLCRPRTRPSDQSNSISNGIAIKMFLEKLHRQRQRAVRLRLGIGLAAVAGEGVVGAGIFVNG